MKTKGPGPLNSNICQPTEMYNPIEIKGFCFRRCNLMPSYNLFMNVTQYLEPELPYGAVPGALRPDGKDFFCLCLYLVGICSEVPQVREAPQNFNLLRARTWLLGVTVYSTIFQQQFTSTSPVFTRQNSLKKIRKGKCSLNKLLNLS